jgi:hypothetical protein
VARFLELEGFLELFCVPDRRADRLVVIGRVIIGSQFVHFE